MNIQNTIYGPLEQTHFKSYQRQAFSKKHVKNKQENPTKTVKVSILTNEDLQNNLAT